MFKFTLFTLFSFFIIKASAHTLNCKVGEFTLNLNDYGIHHNSTPRDISIGNHNPAIIIDFIKNVLITDQNFSFTGQTFKIIDGHIISANLISGSHPQLKKLIFSSDKSICTNLETKLICSSNKTDEMQAEINLHFTNAYSGVLKVYDQTSHSLFTKHHFFCQ